METVFIPTEADSRRWIKEAIEECLEGKIMTSITTDKPQDQEPLLCRKEVADIFKISLVTLHDWMKRGLPFYKQRGRVYFVRSEVMGFVKKIRIVS